MISDGQTRKIQLEVCPVRKPLLSVARLTKAGNIFRASDSEAYIWNPKLKQKTMLRREGNVWMLDFWLKRPPEEGFRRPGE